MRPLRVFALVVAGLIAAQTAVAQPDRKPKAPEPAPAPVEVAPPSPPPYEPQLMRLAEVLGALHHLRTVCGAPDAEIWRDRLAALIEAEATAPDRRDRLAGAFNASFRTWARSYRSCTPSAKLAIDRFLAEASKIADDVRVRYGP